jgi:hypothetical protein
MFKVLEGVGKRLEIHPDRMVIKRSDMLATFVSGAFSDEETVLFSEMAGVHLYQPEKLWLDECKADCFQLIVTRKDHSHVSLTLDAAQAADAQAVRAHLEAQIGLAQR